MSTKKEQIKQQSAGKYFTAIVDKRKYIICPDEAERILIKKEIVLFNTINSDARKKKILKLLAPQTEKKKMESVVQKKVLHRAKKTAIQDLKDSKKEISSGIDSNLDANSRDILKSNNLFKIINNNAYLKPFCEVRLPKTLVNRFVDFIKAGSSLDPLINFWKLALLNPNEIARTKLFDYLANQNITVTPRGYIVTYRMVKKTDRKTIEGKPVFTSAHSGKEEYIMGTAYKLDRKACDEDGSKDCSKGLHTGTHRFIGIVADKKSISSLENKEGLGEGYGTTKTVTTKQANYDSYGTGYDRPATTKSTQKFDNSFGNQAVICLVNPMHVVSVPYFNTRKMRSCELFFCSLVTAEEVIDLVEKDYHIFDHQYYQYELEEINKMLDSAHFKEHVDNLNIAKSLKKKELAEQKLEEITKKLSINSDTINTKALTIADIHLIIKSRVQKVKLLK